MGLGYFILLSPKVERTTLRDLFVWYVWCLNKPALSWKAILINRLILFRQTAFPALLDTAKTVFNSSFIADLLTRQIALILLSEENKIWPFLKIRSISFLLLILSSLMSLTNFYLSSLTVSLFLPFALLLESTLRPFLVLILSLKPCLFFLFLLLGWNVLFIIVFPMFQKSAKIIITFQIDN